MNAYPYKSVHVNTHAANHHEVTLVQLSFDFYTLEAKPEHLIGDRAYDSDGLDAAIKQDGITMIAAHRSTWKLKTQDGRHLRWHECRWLVERFFAVEMTTPDTLGVPRHEFPRLCVAGLYHDTPEIILR